MCLPFTEVNGMIREKVDLIGEDEDEDDEKTVNNNLNLLCQYLNC